MSTKGGGCNTMVCVFTSRTKKPHDTIVRFYYFSRNKETFTSYGTLHNFQEPSCRTPWYHCDMRRSTCLPSCHSWSELLHPSCKGIILYDIQRTWWMQRVSFRQK